MFVLFVENLLIFTGMMQRKKTVGQKQNGGSMGVTSHVWKNRQVGK